MKKIRTVLPGDQIDMGQSKTFDFALLIIYIYSNFTVRPENMKMSLIGFRLKRFTA